MKENLENLYAELNDNAIDLIRTIINKHTTTILEEMRAEITYWRCIANDNQAWFAASERDRKAMEDALKSAEIEFRCSDLSHTGAYQAVVRALQENK